MLVLFAWYITGNGCVDYTDNKAVRSNNVALTCTCENMTSEPLVSVTTQAVRQFMQNMTDYYLWRATLMNFNIRCWQPHTGGIEGVWLCELKCRTLAEFYHNHLHALTTM